MSATRKKSTTFLDTVIRVYADPFSTNDTYTVVYPRQWIRNRSIWPYLSISKTAIFTYHGELTQRPGKHLGKRMRFTDLRPDIQEAIINDIAVDLNDEASSQSKWRVSYAQASRIV